jgi:hypothetical protein
VCRNAATEKADADCNGSHVWLLPYPITAVIESTVLPVAFVDAGPPHAARLDVKAAATPAIPVKRNMSRRLKD